MFQRYVSRVVRGLCIHVMLCLVCGLITKGVRIIINASRRVGFPFLLRFDSNVHLMHIARCMSPTSKMYVTITGRTDYKTSSQKLLTEIKYWTNIFFLDEEPYCTINPLTKYV